MAKTSGGTRNSNISRIASEFNSSGEFSDDFFSLNADGQRAVMQEAELQRTGNKAITSKENAKFSKDLNSSANAMSDNLSVANTFYSTNQMSSTYKTPSERKVINDARRKFNKAEKEYRSTSNKMSDRLSGINNPDRFYSSKTQKAWNKASNLTRKKEFGGWTTTSD